MSAGDRQGPPAQPAPEGHATQPGERRPEPAFEEGRLRLATAYGRIAGAGPAVSHGRARRLWRPECLMAAAAAPGRFTATHEGLRLEWDVVASGDALHFRVAVRNQGNAPVPIHALRPFHLEGEAGLVLGDPPRAWSIFRNGHQSWSPTRSWRSHEREREPPLRILRIGSTDPAHRVGAARGRFRSDLLAAIRGQQSGSGVALGFLGATRQFGYVLVDLRGGRFRSLAAECDLDDFQLAPGAEIASETLQLRFGPDATLLLERQADDLGQCMAARVPERPPSGWCSWYYYFTAVGESDVRENLAELVRLRPRVPLDYVMVDDGHQTAIGDWLSTNAAFPSGMTALAGEIRGAGFDAGLWLAPFLADPRSQLAREHPEWLLRDRRGRPVRSLYNPLWSWSRSMRALDTSRPDVLDWLRELARTLRHAWGYRVLKLDFLYAAALPGVRAHPMTRAQALRAGLEAIRAGAGEDAFLLGCGCPLGPAVGVVDGMRIGHDVSPRWRLRSLAALGLGSHGPSARNAIGNTLARAFLQRRLWANDPDCLLVRERNTQLDLEEVRSLATVIGLSDGMLVVSDRMRELGEARLAVLEQTAALCGGAPRVLDLFDAGLPERMLCRRADGLWVAVCNFADRPLEKAIDLRALPGAPARLPARVTELWTGAVLEVREGRVEFGVVPRHGARVVHVPVPSAPG